MVRVTPKKNKDGREKDKKDGTPKTLERKAKKVLWCKHNQQLDRRVMQKLGAAAGRKTQFSGTLGLPRLSKDTRGAGDRKSRICRAKNIERPQRNCALRCTESEIIGRSRLT